MKKIKYTRVSISPSEIAYMTDYYTVKPDITLYAVLKPDQSFVIHQKGIAGKTNGKVLFSGKGKDVRNAKKMIQEKLQELGFNINTLIKPIC